ncbi:hypothetical protein WT36_01990 [Burkholderia territorii]|nr:hypothetical protein WT36_01990 [Burkholderia territorii]
MSSGVLAHARVIQSKRALPDAESMRREMPAGQDGANAPDLTDGAMRNDGPAVRLRYRSCMKPG